MGHWRVHDGSAVNTAIGNPTSGAANVKGAWSQAFAAAPFDVGSIICSTRATAAANVLFDIGVGGVGSEFVVVPNLHACSDTSSDRYSGGIFIPLYIARGQRIAARSQDSAGSATPVINIFLLGNSLNSGRLSTLVTDYGTDTANSRGTGLVIPASGTSAWTQLTASTTRSHKGVFVSIGSGSAPSTNAIQFNVDIGLGAAASEVVVIPAIEILLRNIVAADSNAHFFGPFPINIPSGTRLAARSTFEGGTGGDTFFVQVHGYA